MTRADQLPDGDAQAPSATRLCEGRAGPGWKSARNDIVSLNEHAAFESHTINFQLDATLGMINIEQNGIIKIFSVAAVVFLPPTLVASIYWHEFSMTCRSSSGWRPAIPWRSG